MKLKLGQNDCFGIKTDQEVKEKGICGSHFKKKKKKNKTKQTNIKRKADRESEKHKDKDFFFIFFFSHFSLRYTEIGPSEFVGARSKVLYSTRATLGNQKHGISSSFQLKFEKSYVLVFLRSTAF